MKPLRTFPVVRQGDLVRVLPPVQHVVIVGAGAAGSFAAAELRRTGFTGRVTLLTREVRLPYDKPNLSKDYLAGRAPQEWIPLRSEEEYAKDGVELRLRAAVDRIDAEESAVHLAGGETIAYDRLILAPGAVPRRRDVPADPAARVHYLRTWTVTRCALPPKGRARWWSGHRLHRTRSRRVAARARSRRHGRRSRGASAPGGPRGGAGRLRQPHA